jgi:membrane protein implicated in regulation of membrane protease activity
MKKKTGSDIGVRETTLSDVTYDLLEYMERERTWMWLVVGVCLGLAPAALFINLFLIRFYLPRIISPALIDFSILLGVVVAVIMIIIGIKQLHFLRRWQRKLHEIRRAERKLYEEVIGSMKK